MRHRRARRRRGSAPGELDKVVLAREVEVEAPAAHDPAALFGALRELFPACFCFCVGTPEAAFIGASPELLVRRSGAVAATVALAGSTRRSADPAVDDHLGEQLLRSDKDRTRARDRRAAHRARAAAALGLGRGRRRARASSRSRTSSTSRPRSTPSSPTRARRSSWRACCTRRRPSAASRASLRSTAIAELEAMDRGWYAGPVGWMDATEDGEFCVALRSALIRDRSAHLFAGCGIVADSDPAAELAETEIKLDALLPLLAG